MAKSRSKPKLRIAVRRGRLPPTKALAASAGTGKGGTLLRPPKPAPAVRLATRASKVAKLTADLAKAKQRIRELETMAETDALLDILNRRGFERAARRAIAYLGRYRGTAALIVLDVDRLKAVNDTFGHAAGDAVLKSVVGVLERQIRASDVVGRLGGDEFAILLWNVTEADARAKAAALEAGIDGLVTMIGDCPVRTGASTGVTAIAADDDLCTVLERGDKAMYARKRSRRMRAGKGSPGRRPQAMMSGVI